MSPETLSPNWAWYLVPMYFFIGGVSAGAYFIGSLVEIFGQEKHRDLSRVAYYIAFPLILITPILLVADLGRPERFWHLFFYVNGGIPYINLQSPLSVGSWALLVFGVMAFLSFFDNLVVAGRIRFAPFAALYNRIPRKVYALVGSLTGFFVASYTGVLVNTTARPLWAAASPLFGALFVVSAGSTGAAAIALVMALRKMAAGEVFEQLETFDRLAMIVEIVLIAVMMVVAGRFAAPLLTSPYALTFWGGTVLVGILVPLALNWYMRRPDATRGGLVTLAAVLALFGGALLRISLVQAGQG